MSISDSSSSWWSSSEEEAPRLTFHRRGGVTSAFPYDRAARRLKPIVARLGMIPDESPRCVRVYCKMARVELEPARIINIPYDHQVEEEGLLSLPDELLVHVVSLLPLPDRLRVARTCMRLYSAAHAPNAWRFLRIPDQFPSKVLWPLLMAHGEHIRELDVTEVEEGSQLDDRLNFYASIYIPRLSLCIQEQREDRG